MIRYTDTKWVIEINQLMNQLKQEISEKMDNIISEPVWKPPVKDIAELSKMIFDDKTSEQTLDYNLEEHNE